MKLTFHYCKVLWKATITRHHLQTLCTLTWRASSACRILTTSHSNILKTTNLHRCTTSILSQLTTTTQLPVKYHPWATWTSRMWYSRTHLLTTSLLYTRWWLVKSQKTESMDTQSFSPLASHITTQRVNKKRTDLYLNYTTKTKIIMKSTWI